MLGWVVIVGAFVAFFLAWSLGANDVANAFGTSVGAKVLTLRQAIFLAAIVEFLGALLLSSEVFDTFRSEIFSPEAYEDAPEELMLGMLAALFGCCMWLFIATVGHLPVSSTHSSVGALVGFHLVARGTQGLNISFLFIIAFVWVASPIIAGLVAVSLFWLVRQFILRHYSSLKRGLLFLPFCYGGTVFIITLYIIYRGSPGLHLREWPTWLVLSISVFAGVLTLILTFFLTPVIRRTIEGQPDESLNAVALELELGARTARNYFEENLKVNGLSSGYGTFDHKIQRDREEVEQLQKLSMRKQSQQNKISTVGADNNVNTDDTHDFFDYYNDEDDASEMDSQPHMRFSHQQKTLEDYLNDEVFQDHVRLWVKRINADYRGEESVNRKMYSKSETFDPKTEELFSFLQILTAMAGGLAHGANDVANAIAPFAVMYSVYENNGEVQQSSPMPFFVLMTGNIGLVMGLAMWGYKIMATIGENLTKITPARGFNVEMGAAMTVLLASRLGLPVSTTHCKVGSVVGVGLVDGKKAVNWRLFINVVLAWSVTLPISGCLSAVGYLFLKELVLD
eukprot:TRINITY_DN6211_c0_g1_i1.p1 TRINITY_DN6211_c0_g1~~TRINITY_DN6211_c0_g1_i1.p1  ORF type:complete len:567 (-),score=77.05 TRINITY_DN6211_c0_g1_i1:44-1744(-)